MSSLWQRIRGGPYRWPLRLVVVLVLGVAVLVWLLFQGWQQHLTVENRSGQTLSRLEITVGGRRGQSTTFQNLPAGGLATTPFTVREGDSYHIEGQLADGSRIRVFGRLTQATHLQILPGGEVKFLQPGGRGGAGVWRPVRPSSRMAA